MYKINKDKMNEKDTEKIQENIHLANNYLLYDAPSDAFLFDKIRHCQRMAKTTETQRKYSG